MCLLLFAATAAVAQNPDSASALFELRRAEQSFAMMSAASGRQAAFAEFIAEEGVIFRGDVIKNGKQYWKEQKPQPLVLKWEPEFQDVAASGDYGYSIGPWELQEYRPYTAPLAYGYFLSVWEKQSDGRWQAILDTGTGGGTKRENHTLTYSFPPNADKPKSYQPVKDLAAAKAELSKLDHALLKSWNAKPESATLIAMLAPDAHVMRRGHAPLTNLDSIKTVLKADTATFNWKSLEANVAPQSGDMGFTYGICEFKNTEGKSQKTVYVRIWKRQAHGEWKIVVDLLHLDLPSHAALQSQRRRNNMPKPDFSGTWKFNPSKSILQIPAPDSSVFVVEHREPVFRIQRTHVFGQKSDTFALDLTTDGKEVTVDRGDMQIRARVYWEGDTLVFDTRLARLGEEATNLVRYKLAETGDSFTAEERFRNKSLNYDNVWVMDKEMK